MYQYTVNVSTYIFTHVHECHFLRLGQLLENYQAIRYQAHASKVPAVNLKIGTEHIIRRDHP